LLSVASLVHRYFIQKDWLVFYRSTAVSARPRKNSCNLQCFASRVVAEEAVLTNRSIPVLQRTNDGVVDRSPEVVIWAFLLIEEGCATSAAHDDIGSVRCEGDAFYTGLREICRYEDRLVFSCGEFEITRCVAVQDSSYT